MQEQQLPEVYLGDDDIVYINFDGDVDDIRAQRMMIATTAFCAELRKKGKKALILAYLTDKGEITTKARDIVAKLVESDVYDKVAAYGHLPFVQHIANFVVMATGASDRAHVCGTESDARAWLSR